MEMGTERISQTQKHMLDRARGDQPPGFFGWAFTNLLTDDEIQTGQEQVHPDWRDIYRKNKSQITRRVPDSLRTRLADFIAMMTPYDPGIGELDPASLKVSFLLGAGASKPGPSNIPTVMELLPDLLTRARRLDREDVTKLADFCEQRKITNIEDLLTAAHLATFCSRNPTVLKLVEFLLYGALETDEPPYPRRREEHVDLSSVAFLQDTLQVLFALLSSKMLPAKPNAGHKAIAEYVKAHAKSEIVTTNYDCCMDLALGEERKDFDYGMEFTNVTRSTKDDQRDTRLIKLHGSLNWFYCETCQGVQLINFKKAVESFLKDELPYPVISVCRTCHGQRRGLVVPPLAMKFDMVPPLTRLLQDAHNAFENTDVIVVVGFSFSEADLYISRMLSKSMQLSDKQKLVVIDPNRDVVEKVRRKYEAIIPDFDRDRIMRIGGDCAEELPKFLGGHLVRKVDATDVVQAGEFGSERAETAGQAARGS